MDGPLNSCPGPGVCKPTTAGESKMSSLNCTTVDQFRPNNMFPVHFHTIRLNTDLNHVPQDWAKTKFQSYGFESKHKNNFSPFTSFNLAHNYMSLIGKVDVMSSAKNIKDLLKLRYHESPQISIMVHRLGKTLLLEEFDVHKNLLRKDAENWQWLKDFFQLYMNKDCDKTASLAVYGSPKKDPLLEERYKNLIMHSITAASGGMDCIEASNELPQNIPPAEEEYQDLQGFKHESLWNFHFKSMLVESNLPIFGSDSNLPCISLRLRDSPGINVVTGLDYWLDNLMSNVPEVAMVYHINGFVQKYEILRTEDIPKIENSEFDPDEVMELAHNLMAFIKSRAAIEGHTYWLYKSAENDMVKLYDLTEYCKKEMRQDDNPFIVPLGLLCYHVGCKLKVSEEGRSSDCRAMLENCIRLLDHNAGNHAQMWSDAHCLLSDMWVPDKSLHDIWHGDGKIEDPPDENTEDDSGSQDGEALQDAAERMDEEVNLIYPPPVPINSNKRSPRKSPTKKEKEKNEVALKELVMKGRRRERYQDVVEACRITGETGERCRQALHHISQALRCIDKDWSKTSSKDPKPSCFRDSPSSNDSETDLSSNVEVERDKMRVANPYIPIPLPYSSLDTEATDSEVKKKGSKASKSPQSKRKPCRGEVNGESFTWHHKMKCSLLRKAAITFCILAHEFHSNQQRGHALRYVRYGLHCYDCIVSQSRKEEHSTNSDSMEDEVYFQLLHLAAKVRSCLDPNIWEESRKDFEDLQEEEAAILHSAQGFVQTPKEAWVYAWSKSEEENLQAARDLYKKLMKMKLFAKRNMETKKAIIRQCGVCILNLGKVAMRGIGDRVENGETLQSFEADLEKAKRCFEESWTFFLKNDEKNNASECSTFLYNLYEKAATALERHNDNPKEPITKEENKWLMKMFDVCEKALSAYERDESADSARERIYNLMRQKYFQMALRYAPNAQAGDAHARKTARDLLNKSLSYCFLGDGLDLHVSDNKMNSMKTGGIVYFNLARLNCMESRSLPYDSPRGRSLHRKMYESLIKAFAIYGMINWSKSTIRVKGYIAENILEESHLFESCPRNMQRLLRLVLSHLCDLKIPVLYIHRHESSLEDDCAELKTETEAMLYLLRLLNKTFLKFLKLEKSGDMHDALKEHYSKSLVLSQKTQMDSIAYPLSVLLSNVWTDFKLQDFPQHIWY